MLDLSLLRHFVAVVETGSFTRAANRLNTSQSGVSRSVSRLEDELGVTLLERTTRKLQMTPAGEALFAEAVASLDRIAVAVDDARRIGRGARARLRIGLCQAVAEDAPIIRQGLKAFCHIWPDVELSLSTVFGVLQPGQLRASTIDVGISQLNLTDSYNLDWRVLKRASLSVAVPLAWEISARKLRLRDLRDRPWILPHPELAAGAYQDVLDFLRAAGFDPKIGGLADDRLTGEIMLSCGLGAALTHSAPVRNVIDGYEVIPLDLPPAGSDIETVVCWASASVSEQVACLADCLHEAAQI